MVASPGQVVAGTPLLETKRYVPRWRPGLVSRPRLVERLVRGGERKLTLVSAPAGFGKTTLLAEWLSTGSVNRPATVWVSLDPGDNDPALFWAYVVTALQGVRSGIGERVLWSLQSPERPPIESLLATLINEVSAIEDEFSLGLDDYHVIDAPPVHHGVTFLLDHLPPRMHLIIAGRSDPPLPLARLRGRGESTELRAADLRFTADEAATFLNDAMGLNLSAGDVGILETRTEGWIAGLQLAALSMQGRADTPEFVAAFAGDDRYVVDYLVEEVLQRQPEPVRNFLLQTSILDRLSGPLCDAVTGREDGKTTLEALERGNLFVVPLDDKRRWYRYHHLFADVLRAHAQEEQPDRLPELHRRAATWFEERGMTVEAIEQARTVGEHETVARLLVANAEAFERAGQNASIARWAASLPAEMVRTRPRLALVHAASAIGLESNLEATRRLTAWADEAIRAIEDGGGIGPVDDRDGTVVGPEGLDALKGEVLALRLQTARDLGPAEVAAIADQALSLLPPTMHRVRATIHMIAAGVQMSRSDLSAALRALDRGEDEARRAQNPFLLACMLEFRGQIDVTRGRLEEGRRSFEAALAAGQVASTELNWALCSLHASLAEILLERGDLAGATERVAHLLALARDAPMRSFVLIGRATAARVFLAAGDTAAAIAQLEEAKKFARGVGKFRFASLLATAELEVYCRTGDLAAAEEVVRARRLSPNAAIDYDNEEELTAYARYLVARGRWADATHLLSRLLPVQRDGGRVQHEIQALVLQAQAYELLDERSRALDSLGRATMLGEVGRFNRTFTGEGPVVTGLLTALAAAVRRGRGPSDAGSPAYLAYLLHMAGRKPEAASTPAPAVELVEPMTAREVEILRLIAAGKRNQEIADQLFIGLPTVKRHIANAYGKLGVRHRTEAVARADQLKLL
jgi:LuxR family maltose regulon positive regulatory protein